MIYEEYIDKSNEEVYLPILHLSRVVLRCNLQEKLHRVTVRFELS